MGVAKYVLLDESFNGIEEGGDLVYRLVIVGAKGSSVSLFVDYTGSSVLSGVVRYDGQEHGFVLGPGGGQVASIVFRGDEVLDLEIMVSGYEFPWLVSVRAVGYGTAWSLWGLAYSVTVSAILFLIYRMLLRVSSSIVLLYPHSTMGFLVPGLVIWVLGPPPLAVYDQYGLPVTVVAYVRALMSHERFWMGVSVLAIISGSFLLAYDPGRRRDHFEYSIGVYGLRSILFQIALLYASFIAGFLGGVAGYVAGMRVLGLAFRMGLVWETVQAVLLGLIVYSVIVLFLVMAPSVLSFASRRPVAAASLLLLAIVLGGLPWWPVLRSGYSISVRSLEEGTIVEYGYRFGYLESFVSVAGYLVLGVLMLLVLLIAWRLR